MVFAADEGLVTLNAGSETAADKLSFPESSELRSKSTYDLKLSIDGFFLRKLLISLLLTVGLRRLALRSGEEKFFKISDPVVAVMGCFLKSDCTGIEHGRGLES